MSVDTQRLVGGVLCLDFANSVDWGGDGRELSDTDVLVAPQDLVGWGRRTGAVAPGAAPVAANRELARARTLRRAVHEVFTAIATGLAPSDRAVQRLCRDHGEAAGAAHLDDGTGTWRLEWGADDPRRIRFAVAASAVDLLRDEELLGRLHTCPGNDCGWLFVDPTGRRRWCSMDVCGSRAKMRRLYERKRRAAGG
jgi:predicted RNA-binding Zn ribbon-like protein